MKLNTTFEITVPMRVYDPHKPEPYDEDRIYTFTDIEAACFLFRFSPNPFIYHEFKVIITRDDNDNIKGISFIDNEKKYSMIVRSNAKFFTDLLQGYEKVRFLSKLAAMSDMADFQAIDGGEEVLDEFDDNVEIRG